MTPRLPRRLVQCGALLLDLVYPPVCVLCGEYSQGELLCPVCAQAADGLRSTGDQEQLTLGVHPEMDLLLSPFAYAGPVKNLLLSLKRRSDRRGVAYLSGEIAAAFADSGLTADGVTCMPMSRKKLRQRGFNHAELLGRAVASRLGLPFDPHLLRMDSAAATQHSLSRQDRLENARRNITAGPAEIPGGTLLLIDDICTTGSSLAAASRVLKQKGAVRVIAATAAITPE